jgi:hypothetical protein
MSDLFILFIIFATFFVLVSPSFNESKILRRIIWLAALSVVLAVIIYPNFLRYGPPGPSQREAKSNLGSIFTSQVTYFGEEDTYASSIENLGWVPEGKTYYSYSMIEGNATQFIARAEANIDKDPTLDVWEIDHTRRLENVENDVIQ